ncbi:Iron-sulfur assembly protein 1 [Tulasnella sp. JGI-2019a]|nr:Iron-sulfur assembly protein 1 [Tulasnella sp. JGI-2019a]
MIPQSQTSTSPQPSSSVASSSKSVPSISPEQGSVAGPKPPAPSPIRKTPKIKASKAAITLTPSAVAKLQALISGPTPQLIRIGVRNKGCAGMAYHLEYVDKPGRFDEVVEQEGVKVLIDSKALFSIIGSQMDWVEDRMRRALAFALWAFSSLTPLFTYHQLEVLV